MHIAVHRRSSPRGKLEPELLAHYVGKEPPHECGRLLKYRRELQIRITQLAREGSPPPGCAYLSEVVTQIQTGSSRTDSLSGLQEYTAPSCTRPTRSRARRWGVGAPQNDGAPLVQPNEMERVLAGVDPDRDDVSSVF